MGFLISKEFPNRFLSGDEVVGKVADLVIRDVKKEKARSPKTQKEEPVLVVYFEGKDRGVCLGKERAKELRTIIGSDDTDGWKGKTVRIYTKKKKIGKLWKNILHFQTPGSAPVIDEEEEQAMLDDSEIDLDTLPPEQKAELSHELDIQS
jgi:hypothetical protein